MENLKVFFDFENENEFKIPEGLKKSLQNRQLTFKTCDVKPYEKDKMISQVSLSFPIRD